MIRKEISTYRTFCMVATATSDWMWATKEMSEFRRRSPLLYHEFKNRFDRQRAKDTAMGYRLRATIFD